MAHPSQQIGKSRQILHSKLANHMSDPSQQTGQSHVRLGHSKLANNMLDPSQ